MQKELVSIIIPAYNCEEYIQETIDSIKNQTYENFEAIFIDDCSTDQTAEIILENSKEDKRIKYHKLETNGGAAVARNKAIEFSKGSYLAFLDSDDIWVSQKLEKQISFMKANNYFFSCSYYGKMNNDSKIIDGTVMKYKPEGDYNYLLRECPGNSTVIYNAKELGKFTIPNIRKRNDYVMWLQVIKKAEKIFCYESVLSYHRIRKDSLSANKVSLVKYHWKVYRNIEGLSFLNSVYLISHWIKKSLVKG